MSDSQQRTDPQASPVEHSGDLARDPIEAEPDAQPTEDELRAAYEAELSRIATFELSLQTVVSLLNIGGRRLGLGAGTEEHRDLEQVRDAIDGVRALMPILERRMPAAELRPLRDALAQLQMAYTRDAATMSQDAAQKPAEQAPAENAPKGAGPAEASGRLWVPGR